MLQAPEVILIIGPNVVSGLLVRVLGSTRDPACPQSRLQPPGYVFAIVWPILYLLLGVTMSLLYRDGQHRHLVCTGFLVLALNMWWVMFGSTCHPKAALLSILALLVAVPSLER
jgi:tryptophan-rich sensory protein